MTFSNISSKLVKNQTNILRLLPLSSR